MALEKTAAQIYQRCNQDAPLCLVRTLTALYEAVMTLRVQDPLWEDRDRLLISESADCTAYYAALCRKGFISHSEFEALLSGALSPDTLPGVDAVPAPRGTALASAVKQAIKARADIKIYKNYVIIDQADCLCGALWESAIEASENMLDDLCLILCRPAGDILPGADNICAKFSAFGFDTLSVSADSADAVALALSLPQRRSRPRFVLCEG